MYLLILATQIIRRIVNSTAHGISALKVYHHFAKIETVKVTVWEVFIFGVIWSASSRIWTEYGEIRRIQSECGKMRTRITANTGTFHAMGAINQIRKSIVGFPFKHSCYFGKFGFWNFLIPKLFWSRFFKLFYKLNLPPTLPHP